MGTNFYWHNEKEICPSCGSNPLEPLHIGKSSVGWAFNLHIHPHDGIRSLEDWKALFRAPGSRIVDEYGREFTSDEMIDWITNRSHPQGLMYNDSIAVERAPDGGTYVLIVREFS